MSITRTSLGDRSCTFSGPCLRNNLLLQLRDSQLTLLQFRRVSESDLIELVEAPDDKLFRLIFKVNHCLLLPKSDNRYNLRKNIITENYYRKTLICLTTITL